MFKIKNFDIKFLNISFWITLILAYTVPTKQAKIYGFPFKFFKVYSESQSDSLIFSSEFRILSFLSNVIIIVIILNLLNKLILKIKNISIQHKKNNVN